MKKIIYSMFLLALGLATSCSDKFLNTDNLYEKSLDNFYSRPQDIDEAMAGVYTALYVNAPLSMESISANLMSDMMFGGGGPDDKAAKYVDTFTDPDEDTYRDLWVENFNGINRANAIIEKTEAADFSNFFDTEEEAIAYKKQAIGEAHFMRAFFYFRGAKYFGGLPLILSIEDPRDAPRSSFTETFAQIASDLKIAIETMPSQKFQDIEESRFGHANKWVAEAYMAKAFLFYTGYMTNIENQATSELPLAEGGSLSKTDVVAYLDDCINNSGYGLVGDFRNLWPYSYVNISAKTFDPTATEPPLPWAADNNLSWAGQDGLTTKFGTGNDETMFMVRYAFGNWGWDNGQKYNNRASLFMGIRDNSMVPFGTGWGWGTVNPKLWSSWDDADPRKEGSIIQVGNAEQGTAGYERDKGDNETGFFNKKYTNLQHNGPDGVQGMFYYLYKMVGGDMQLWSAQDFILMRFADVLLMHSEISETATGMNAVRRRAGLIPIAYSLNAIKEERLHEFAFEGIRWFDLVRWGDVSTAFNGTVDVRNSGIDAKYSVQYRPETKGLVPIPETEIRLANGVYDQNPGW